MKPILVMAATAALIALGVRARPGRSRAAYRRVRERQALRDGPSAAAAKTTFVVHGMPAADVMRTVIQALGCTTTRSSRPGAVFLLNASDHATLFAARNRRGETWASSLVIRDEVDGAHGDYAAVRWLTRDGVPTAWKEMETVADLVRDAITGVGGTVKVTIPG
jgi:hypothetical protein